MGFLGDVKRDRNKKTVLSGVMLLGIGAFWLSSMGLSDAKIAEIIATALVFAGTSIISVFVASKILGGN